MAHISGYGYEQEVVGESNYTETLAKAFADGNIKAEGKRSYVMMSLVLEDDNLYDINAVAVISNHGIVGYLPRDDAKEYRKLYGTGETNTIDAVIITRDHTLFGVWLDITLDDEELYMDYTDEELDKYKAQIGQFKVDKPVQTVKDIKSADETPPKRAAA